MTQINGVNRNTRYRVAARGADVIFDAHEGDETKAGVVSYPPDAVDVSGPRGRVNTVTITLKPGFAEMSPRPRIEINLARGAGAAAVRVATGDGGNLSFNSGLNAQEAALYTDNEGKIALGGSRGGLQANSMLIEADTMDDVTRTEATQANIVKFKPYGLPTQPVTLEAFRLAEQPASPAIPGSPSQ